jgi:hypothetical protein
MWSSHKLCYPDDVISKYRMARVKPTCPVMLMGPLVYLISTKGSQRVWPVSRGCVLLRDTWPGGYKTFTVLILKLVLQTPSTYSTEYRSPNLGYKTLWVRTPLSSFSSTDVGNLQPLKVRMFIHVHIKYYIGASSYKKNHMFLFTY